MRKLAVAGFVVAWPLAALAQQANGWGNEQVHGGDVRRMVMQEGAPSRGGRSASPGLRELAIMQADPAQGAEQDIGHRIEPQAQLVGPHRGGRGAIRIEVELALLDPA